MDKKSRLLEILSLLTILVAAVICGTQSLRAAQGTRDLSFGTITNVRCRGRRLDMNLKTANETLHLYTTNYLKKVEFTAANFTPKGKLDPCKEITGFKAKAIFYDIPHRPKDGELISVELTKPKSQ